MSSLSLCVLKKRSQGACEAISLQGHADQFSGARLKFWFQTPYTSTVCVQAI